MTTEQEAFWKSEFGDAYTARNINLVDTNMHFFEEILFKTSGIGSIIEFGAGSGQNLKALKRLRPHATLSAVEINQSAIKELETVADHVVNGSLLSFEAQERWDLTFTKGVLIHIAPENLTKAYEVLYQHSNKYILIAEYYSKRRTELEYRGHSARMWKADFAGEFMAQYPDVNLVSYGFASEYDPVAPQDNINWFLFSKG